MKYVIGVDVGTGSARAGVFDEAGKMCATETAPIPMHKPEAEWAEQSTTAIWQAICKSVRGSLAKTTISPADIVGISYSATCSLVLLDQDDKPLQISPGDELWDVVVWMDHRAVAEAEEITQSGSVVLKNLGGVMSPEMEIPKLMWLKRQRPELWARLGFAGDLADYLTYRSCGSTQRSVCTLGCKWTYDPDAESWNHDFLSQVGLTDLLEKAKLPDTAVPIGTHLGPLKSQAADDLGLTVNCKVAAGLIDAHAGALGTLGLFADDNTDRRIALIAGTSNCHITLSNQRREVPGIWGPYGGAVLDDMWSNEGGQSASGALLDHVVDLFGGNLSGANSHKVIAERVQQCLADDPEFAVGVQVMPDFIGNRAPFADPEMRGAITGLTIEDPEMTFLKVYWAAAVGIAYGTRLIIDRLNEHGFMIDTIHLSGGHKNSDFLVGLYGDATGCKVVLADTEEPVLLGAAMAAMLQFVAEDGVKSISTTMSQGYVVREVDAVQLEIHEKRYRIFRTLYGQKQGDDESCCAP